jgi:alanyl-tRNA synthetase
VTERLYYTDPYLTQFEADVLDVETAPDGRLGAVLNRTAFYPTSGGQPFDTGMLSGVRVTDVVDREDGTILHVTEGHPPKGRIQGQVDWDRRFEHMQQHTGQHVLSAAFDRLLAARTVSFHLGSTSSTIDLSLEVSPQDLARVETEANRIVWEDRAVDIRFATAAEAANLPLRKESLRGGELRLIVVDGYDLSACGGTHVSRTGAIGIIATATSERFRNGTRVEFLCGIRALRVYRSLRDSIADSTRLLSVLPTELTASIDRIQTEARELRRRNKDLQVSLAAFEADKLAGAAERHGTAMVVIRAVEGWDTNGLKQIAAHLVSRPGYVALLLATSTPALVVVARSADVAIDSAAILGKLIAQFGGKGGGRPELAQGGGLNGTPTTILEYARSLIFSVA